MASDALWGFSSSAIALSLTYPADTLSRYGQVSAIAGKRFSLKSFTVKTAYKGLTPALATQPLYWALYTPLYQKTKQGYLLGDMVAGFGCGAVATLTTNPLWVLRQRMQTELLKDKNNTYRQLVRELYVESGINSFFRGAGITLVKNVQMALLLPMFDRLRKNQIWEGQSPFVAAVLSGAFAKIVSSTIVYPLDVIRTNIRYIEAPYVTVGSVTKQIYQRPGGMSNFFRGIGWYWIGSSLTFGIMMGIQSLTIKSL